MKIKLRITIFFILFSGSLAAQWKEINIDSVDGTINFISISLASENTGFVAGCNEFSAWSTGVILKTDDGGKTWEKIYHPIGNCVSPVSFISENTGYNGGQSFMKTTDGGKTWSTPDNSLPGIITPSIIYFINDSLGFRDNGKSAIAKTTDGGKTWSVKPIHSSSILTSIFFTSPLNGYAVGYNNPVLLKTTNGGGDWDTISTAFSLLSVHFPSKETGYAVGHAGTIIKTTDEGKNWFKQNAGLSPNISIRSVFCLDDRTCYAVADSGIILFTGNGGLNWDIEPSGTSKNLNCIKCTKKGVCYIAADSFTLLKKDNGMTGVKELGKNKKKDDLIIYPNPSSGEIIIEYSELNAGTNSCIVFSDMLGRYLTTVPLDNEVFTPNTVTVDIGRYGQGLYRCQFYKNDILVETKTIIVVR